VESYDIVFSEGAIKDLKVIPQKEQLKILDKIELLAANPFPKGCVKIKTTNDALWRFRQGNYRILYSIESEIKVIDSRRISHRKNVYR
jgi:mRNA interferase RelE/StbE